MVFTIPVQARGTATISMVDLKSFNPDTFKFPGQGAFNFHPGIATVALGGSVTFSTEGFEEHTVTSFTEKVLVDFEGATVNMPVADGKFDSGIATPIESGESWTLDTSSLATGDYSYFCQIHPWMQALLHIADHGPSSASVRMDHHIGNTVQFFAGSASWGFLPRNLRVSKGTTVTVNNDGMIFHTFSSYTVTIPVVEGGHTLKIPISNGVFNATIAPGDSWALDTQALDKGTYTYACLFHPWMLGTLTVT